MCELPWTGAAAPGLGSGSRVPSVGSRNFGRHVSLGAWVAQSVKHLTLAQVMISWLVSSSPTSGSVLTARSLELLPILCLPLSLPLPCSCSVSQKINKHLKKIFLKRKRCTCLLQLWDWVSHGFIFSQLSVHGVRLRKGFETRTKHA